MSKILKLEQTISNVKVINFTGLELENVLLILTILNQSPVLTEINLSSNRIPAPVILELMKVLEDNPTLKILKIGRQSNKHFSYTEESKILKQLKKLQLRKFSDFFVVEYMRRWCICVGGEAVISSIGFEASWLK